MGRAAEGCLSDSKPTASRLNHSLAHIHAYNLSARQRLMGRLIIRFFRVLYPLAAVFRVCSPTTQLPTNRRGGAVVTPVKRARAKSERAPRSVILAGRFFIALVIVLIMGSLFTVRYWTFDNFPHGGQDFELTLITLMALICLVLLVAVYAKRGVEVIFDVGRILSLIFSNQRSEESAGVALPPSYHGPPIASSALASYNVPLRI
jgi:hypothetical protein